MGYILNLRKKVGKIPLIMVTSSAIIAKNNQILLQYRTDFKEWALHGGSMEPGENLTDTLVREVKEEIGLDITEYTYFKTYSGKDFKITYPNGDVVYLVESVYIVTDFTGEIKLDLEEVSNIKWFPLNELPWDLMMEHNKTIVKDYIKERVEG